VARMALAYRNHFKRDFVIDLIGYRRYGHNEGDEPRFTQPKMYAIIDALPTVREQWAKRLAEAGVVDTDSADKLLQQQKERLQEELNSISGDEQVEPGIDPPPPAGSDDTDPDDPRIEVDATQTASADERLRSLDFEQMSAAEAARARRMLSRLALPVRPLPTRRLTADPRGRRPDPRRTLRGALRTGGEVLTLAHRKPATRWPALVVLCDISGSMASYSRMVLHFVHAVANRQGQGWARVHAFTFGTRLTNITRHLRTRDVDAALNAAGHEARDWQGGTRIGACLHQFNRDWSRRVLGQGAVVLLITDGLDRDDAGALAKEMERLHLSARRLIWLNPLLRWDGFAPKATGIRAMLPHVDSFRAGHSIQSLEQLAEAISRPDDMGEKARLMALL